ncbi:hypothetical protein BKA63DRAFT_496957 [Paraphoma chrysanthemicola]|nr:hypothetical protein BKA63DRAFT_496957 [Paraphoma chrysanthemicola]
MHFVRIIMFAFTLAAAALALPGSFGRTEPAIKVENPKHYYLSANWSHGTSVVSSLCQLLSDSASRTSLSLRLLLVSTFVLFNSPTATLRLGDGDNDEDSNGPFLVALKPTNGTQITGMTVLYVSKANFATIQSDVETCPADSECIAHQWTFDAAGIDMIHHNFRFAGSNGEWDPIKDVAPEEWDVYWKGGGGLDHPITLDLVGANDHNRRA